MAEQFRLRITYSKDGRLRWLSHLELMRAMERLVRRSGLPYAVTQGFNKHMRFAIGPALPVGTAGINEIFDVWMTNYVAPDRALSALQAAADDTLPVRSVLYVPTSAKGLQATHTVSHYLVLVSAGTSADRGTTADVAGRLAGSMSITGNTSSDQLQIALDELLVKGQIEVSHKKGTKQFDLSDVIIKAPKVLDEATDDGQLLVACTLKTLDNGSIRPEQLIKAALYEWQMKAEEPGGNEDTARQNVTWQILSVVRTLLE